jgi:acyl-coenzyme A thioesterase PaaI-like protein
MAPGKTLVGLDGEAFWAEYEAIMGPEGLMTYRYIGSSGAVAHDRHHSESTAIVRRDMRGPAGILAAAFEIMGGDCLSVLDDAIAIPAPVQCALGVLDGGDDVGEARIFGEILHEGRTQIFTRFRVEDAAQTGRVLAVGTNQSVVMGPTPEGHRYVPPGPGMADSPALPPLFQAFGGKRRADGTYEIPGLNPQLGSTSGSLHHGPTQVLLEAAATDAAVDAAGGDPLRLVQWNVVFVATGKIGPFVTDVEMIANGPSTVGCAVSLTDGGNGGRRIAAATAVFARG